jgi:hypothetical protein
MLFIFSLLNVGRAYAFTILAFGRTVQARGLGF